MSARKYPPPGCGNMNRPVKYFFSITSLAGGAVVPTFLEGDGFNSTDVSAATATGTYLKLTYTGVGVYTVTTLDPFPGEPIITATLCMATPAFASVVVGVPTQGTYNGVANAWRWTLNVFNGSGALELVAGDIINVVMAIRNGLNTP